MKERLIALRAKLDAVSLRERAMIFAASAGVIVFLFHTFYLNPLLARQNVLRAQIAQQQNHIAGISDEITALVKAHSVDPDKEAREHLNALRADAAALSEGLRAMQNGLIAPQRVAPLLETMLKENGRLKLVSLRSLPVAVLNPDSAAPTTPATPTAPASPDVAALDPRLANLAAKPAAPNPAPVAKPVTLLYRHGVELTVRGNYLDMVDYMATLESMPARVIWGKADLSVEQYPTARLTLTVYTLGLDEKWMKL
jgi:MSHA biogenesis protein MshJ